MPEPGDYVLLVLGHFQLLSDSCAFRQVGVFLWRSGNVSFYTLVLSVGRSVLGIVLSIDAPYHPKTTTRIIKGTVIVIAAECSVLIAKIIVFLYKNQRYQYTPAQQL